ncbi:hypothetical protein Vretifemale_7756, partial [Volvox reticuliferus]
MDREGRAADLLTRIELCGLQTGVNAFDLYSKDVREVFRGLCAALADSIQLTATTLALGDPSKLKAAAQAVRAATASQRDAQMNRLDIALLGLLKSIDATTQAKERVEVLEQLISCLQAARLAASHEKEKPALGTDHHEQQPPPQQQESTKLSQADAIQVDGGNGGMAAVVSGKELQARTVDVSRALRLAAEALQVPLASDSDGGSCRSLPLLQRLVPRVETALEQLGPSFLAPICKREDLTAEQLAVLGDINAAFREEYELRRAVLVERAKVTLQAFEWSGRLVEKGTSEEASGVAAAARRAMAVQPQVSLDDVWSLRPADAVALTSVPTSTPIATLDAAAVVAGYSPGMDLSEAAILSGRKRAAPMGAGIKSVIIGKVPDRGGRPEGRSREAYMPEFRPRSAGGGGG